MEPHPRQIHRLLIDPRTARQEWQDPTPGGGEGAMDEQGDRRPGHGEIS